MNNCLIWATTYGLIICLSALLAGCQPPAEDSFAKVVPSAVVEVREQPSPEELAKETQVVVLGTGNPIPDAHRAGPSIAVIHKGQAYLFDLGAGAVRNATVARYKYDIPSLYPSQICCVFFTHLHSDHMIDYPELAATLWWRRREPLQAWGPNGLEQMTAGYYDMMAPDMALRSGGDQPLQAGGHFRVQVTEITDGIVFDNDGLTIEAFSVPHGGMKPAFGYRINAGGRTIVISGDTGYSEEVLEKSRGADILFHEVISDSGLSGQSEFWKSYHTSAHTLASQLGMLASEARPGLLVLYHALFYGIPEQDIVDEVRSTYDGEVVLANDLDIY